MLLAFCLFTVFVFGGCSGGGGDSSGDYLLKGKYYVDYGESYSHPSWDILYNDKMTYITVHSFSKYGSDYEFTFSGIISWRDGGGTTRVTNIPRTTILMTWVAGDRFMNKNLADPYILIEIWDEDYFSIETDDLYLELIY